MKFLKPVYYDDFKCVGNKCMESCCIGWKVVIDKNSYYRYKKVNGEFGKELNNYISRNRNGSSLNSYGKINLTSDGRCPMLTQDNLCSLYINIGEDYLCDTCKVFPRLIKKYKDICECDLTFACSEVIKKVMKYKEPIEYNLIEQSYDTSNNSCLRIEEYDNRLYDLLWKGRSFAIEIAQFREIDLWKRLVFINLLEKKLQKIIDSGEYLKVDSVIEEVRIGVTDYETIKSLDSIEDEQKVKQLFISAFSQAKVNSKVNSKRFMNMLNDFNDIVVSVNSDNILDVLKEYEMEFDLYIKEYEYMFEHYIVHNMFVNFMGALNNKKLQKQGVMMVITYALLKRLLMVRWLKNDKQLEDEDIIDVFFSFAKAIHHNDAFIEEIYRKIKEAGYDSLAYLTILVR